VAIDLAIDRRSRSAQPAVEDDETGASAVACLGEASAVACLGEAPAAVPFRVTRVPTDRGSRFTAGGVERACRGAGGEHRKTKPHAPRTNGMVGRFNGRVRVSSGV
jgi:transposase InsO family protein